MHELLSERLGQPASPWYGRGARMEETAEALISKLRRDPSDQDAFSALKAYYGQIGDSASLANLIEGWAKRESGAAACDAFTEAGDVVLGHLQDGDRAIALYRRALQHDSAAPRAWQGLERSFEQRGEFRRLYEVLEQRAAVAIKAHVPSEQRALIQHRLGEVAHRALQRTDLAVKHFSDALQLNPNSTASIYALRELYYANGDFAQVCRLYEIETRAETDPERRTALWMELSDLRLQRLGDPDGAADALRQARSSDPRNPQLLHNLATLLLQRSETISDPSARSGVSAEAADALFELAMLVEPTHAATYCEAALDASACHEGALTRLEQLYSLKSPERLAPRWLAYIVHSTNPDGTRRRRFMLGAAYRQAEQYADCAECLEPLLADGDPAAAQILVEIYRDQNKKERLIAALNVVLDSSPTSDNLALLREAVRTNVDLEREDAAFARAKELLALEPGDPEMLSYLETVCRARDDYATLRDALQAASRSGSTPLEGRKQRLKFIAEISLTRLQDPHGAMEAWRTLLALDPADEEALAALANLLREHERWNELVEVIERQVIAAPDDATEISMLRALSEVHHTHRQDPPEAIRSLRKLHSRVPEDLEVRDLLCELLLQVGAAIEATPLMRARIQSATDAPERVNLMMRLADSLVQIVGDDEGAYEVYVGVLDEEVDPEPILDQMLAIDTRLGEWERMLNTLSYRCETVEDDRRPSVLLQMAEVAHTKLGDGPRGIALLGQALDFEPGRQDLIDRLYEGYVAENMLRQLVSDLKTRAESPNCVDFRGEYYRRIARVLSDKVGNQDAAQEAWLELLASGEDEEALRFMRQRAERYADLEDLADYNRRLAAILQDDTERREILLERARLLAGPLERPADAHAELSSLIEGQPTEDLESLDLLARTLIAQGALAEAHDYLIRRLAATPPTDDPLPAAQLLADIGEGALRDDAAAITGLERWCAFEPNEEAARHRLVGVYLGQGRTADAIIRLDELIALNGHSPAAMELGLRAAKLEVEEAKAVDAGWARLKLLVAAGDPASEEYLRKMASSLNRHSELAELFIDEARTKPTPEAQQARWLDAAVVYERDLQDIPKALEATLRAFAINLADTQLLSQVEQLATRSQGWARLEQVYNKLLATAEADTARADLLFRHARLLEANQQSPSDALDRGLQGWDLNPSGDERLDFLENLAARAKRTMDLLPLYDAALRDERDTTQSLTTLLKLIRITYAADRSDLSDGYVERAVDLSLDHESDIDRLESEIRAIDTRAPNSTQASVVRTLADLFIRRAETAHEEDGSRLFARAAHLMADVLNDTETALDVWRAGTFLWPENDDLLEEMETFCEANDRLKAFSAHLDKLVQETVDSDVASRLLDRWGRLLEVGIEDYDAAVQVYRKLLNLSPDDRDVARRLRRCLEHQGRHQEVLGIIRHELDRTTTSRNRADLLHEAAVIWEHDIENRWEAMDAWRLVLAENPEHEEAREALERLGHSTRRLSEEELSPSVEALIGPRSEFTDGEESLTELDGVSSRLFPEREVPRVASDDHRDLEPDEESSVSGSMRGIEAHTILSDDEEEDSLVGMLATQARREDAEEETGVGITPAEQDESTWTGPAPSELVDSVSNTGFEASPSGVVDLGSDLVSLVESLGESDVVELDSDMFEPLSEGEIALEDGHQEPTEDHRTKLLNSTEISSESDD